MAVWTRRTLRAAGWDDAQLLRAIRAGTIVRVGFDRYSDVGPLPLDQLVAPVGSATALAGLSAARAWGLPVRSDAVTVVVPRGCRRPALPHEVTVRETRDWSVVVLDGMVVTDLDRTLLDVARTEPLDVAVPILDAGLRRRPDLDLPWSRTPGNARARRAFALADARAESPLESLLRLTLALAGLPPADLQHPVREGRCLVARVDLWYPGLVVEADGFEFHSARADYRSDRRKGQAFARLGLLVLRFSWEDVVGSPDDVAWTVRAALAASSTLPRGASPRAGTRRVVRAASTRQRPRRATA